VVRMLSLTEAHKMQATQDVANREGYMEWCVTVELYVPQFRIRPAVMFKQKTGLIHALLFFTLVIADPQPVIRVTEIHNRGNG